MPLSDEVLRRWAIQAAYGAGLGEAEAYAMLQTYGPAGVEITRDHVAAYYREREIKRRTGKPPRGRR